MNPGRGYSLKLGFCHVPEIEQTNIGRRATRLRRAARHRVAASLSGAARLRGAARLIVWRRDSLKDPAYPTMNG
jgi:hypothetical protein